MQRNYIEYEPVHRTEYRPVERKYTDYMEIQHELNYIPVPRIEKRIGLFLNPLFTLFVKI